VAERVAARGGVVEEHLVADGVAQPGEERASRQAGGLLEQPRG
jgi:hypothetical protein